MSNLSVNWLRTGVRILRAILLASCTVLVVFIVSIQIEQHILRRRAERLLADILTLQIHRSTFADVENLGHRWKRFTHWDSHCSAESCGFEIGWDDFYLRHVSWLDRFNLLHPFMMAGGRPQTVWAGVLVENGSLTRKNFHVMVGAEISDGNDRWTYALIGNAGSDPNLLAVGQPSPQHPRYIIRTPSGCEVCKDVTFSFDPSLDSATVNRLMQFDLSCLTRWIHPCREEGDIMPNAWAQIKSDHSSTVR